MVRSRCPCSCCRSPLLILGVVIGGVTWWRQGVHRKAARAGRREAVRLEAERSRLAAEVAAREGVVAGIAGPSGATALPAPGASRAA